MASTPISAESILGNAASARGEARSQGTVIEQSRAIAEVQGALMVADRRPRDKMKALNEALESCRTKEVAESAFFKFNRGGGSVSGETVHLARELARCWGNIVYAVVELDRNDGHGVSEMMAYAWDLETNARCQLQFLVPHYRDKKGGPSRLTDMRDIYENNANMGARRLRECIFAVLPPYLTKTAAEQCHATLQGGSDEKPLPVRIAEAIAAFEGIGVSKDRIEAKLGSISRFTPVDYANLRVSFASIKRNEISADEEFPRTDRVTAAALIEQANDPAFDPETGEVLTGRSDEQHGDQHDGAEDPHPAQILTDDMVERCQRATLIGDVIGVEGDLAKHREAMPDELVGDVERAVEAARARIKGGVA